MVAFLGGGTGAPVGLLHGVDEGLLVAAAGSVVVGWEISSFWISSSMALVQCPVQHSSSSSSSSCSNFSFSSRFSARMTVSASEDSTGGLAGLLSGAAGSGDFLPSAVNKEGKTSASFDADEEVQILPFVGTSFGSPKVGHL